MPSRWRLLFFAILSPGSFAFGQGTQAVPAIPAEEEVSIEYNAIVGASGEIELVPYDPAVEQSLALAGVEDLRPVAVEAAKQLLQAAKDTVCDFEPLPETVSPSVEVHFSLLAGGSFRISAIWSTAQICE
jgi:hypothetical protein